MPYMLRLEQPSNPDRSPVCIHRNVWRDIKDGGKLKYGIYVHRFSWVLNEDGAILGFDRICMQFVITDKIINFIWYLQIRFLPQV